MSHPWEVPGTKWWLLHQINYCGCMGEAPIVVLRNYLRNCASKDDENREREKHEKWMLTEDQHLAGLAYLLEATCDRIGLTEHGVSCRWAWLTPLGEQVLELLNGVEDMGAWLEEDWDE